MELLFIGKKSLIIVFVQVEVGRDGVKKGDVRGGMVLTYRETHSRRLRSPYSKVT